jgi:hypothetical protein
MVIATSQKTVNLQKMTKRFAQSIQKVQNCLPEVLPTTVLGIASGAASFRRAAAAMEPIVNTAILRTKSERASKQRRRSSGGGSIARTLGRVMQVIKASKAFHHHLLCSRSLATLCGSSRSKSRQDSSFTICSLYLQQCCQDTPLLQRLFKGRSVFIDIAINMCKAPSWDAELLSCLRCLGQVFEHFSIVQVLFFVF